MGIDPHYPRGSVRALLESDLVTAPTRRAMQARLRRPRSVHPRVFDQSGFATIVAVCARLVPQPDRQKPIDLAATLDARLADDPGDGWRYAVMPPDAEMHTSGAGGIDQSAAAMFGREFVRLSGEEQDSVLRSVQAGTAPGEIWVGMAATRYFEELLAIVIDIYYGHPLALEEIGYAGMADAHGWRAMGLDERESHEPQALTAHRRSA